jgi:hypothetical protein
MSTSFEARSEILERPVCPACATLMWLEKIVSDSPAREVRTFKCPVCHEIAVRDVVFRASSAAPAVLRRSE